MAADGTLYIETAIDTDGFVAGGKDVEAAAKRMSKTVSKIGENFDLGSVLGDVIIVCKSLQKSMDNLTSAMVKGFKKAGSAAKEAAKETEKLAETEKYTEKLAKDMQNLKITRMDDTVYPDDEGPRFADIQDYALDRNVMKAVDEFAQSLDGAGRSSNRFKKQLDELEGKLDELEGKGLYFGDDEYDEAYIALKELDGELKEYVSGLNEAAQKDLVIDTSTMEAKLDGLKQRLKELKSQGFGSGDKSYDQTVVEINNVTKAIKDYRKELINAAQGIRLPGLDTMEGQINALKAKLIELKNQGLSFGSEEFDQTALALKRATQAMFEYQQNLFKTEAQIQKEEAAQRKLNEELERTRQKEAAAAAEAEELQRIGASAKVSRPHVVKLRQALEELLERQKKLEKAGLGFGYKEYDTNAKKIKKLKDSLSKYTGETKKAHKATELFGNAWKKLGTVSKKLGNQVGKLASHLNATKKSSDHARMSLGKMLGMSVLFSTVFRAISGVTNGIKEGMQNLAQYSDRTNASLSLLMSSLTRLKNSFATAFAPILSVVAPIMSSFIDMISRGTTYVGMFFASLTGQESFTRAKAVQQDYAASLDKTSKSTKKAAKATKDAAKDARGSLAPWDELNVIQMDLADNLEDTPDVAAPEIGELTPQDMFEEVPIKSSIKNFADRIKKLIKAQDWNGIGKLLGQQINKGLKKANKAIKWDTVGDDITKGVDGITGIFNALVDEIDWEYMGDTAGEGLNTLFKTLNQLIEKTDWKNLGKGFAEFANGLMDTVEWDEVGRFLGNKVMMLWDTLSGAVHELNWEDIGISIGETLNAMFAKISFSDIADTLTTGINGAFKSLDKFTETFDWKEFADNVSEGISDFLEKTDWEENGQALGNFLSNLLLAIRDVMTVDKFKKIGEGIGTFLAQLPWDELLLTAADVIVNSLGGLMSGLAETPAGLFVDALIVAFTSTKLISKLSGAFKTLFGTAASKGSEKALEKTGGKGDTLATLTGGAILSYFGFKGAEWVSTNLLGGEKKSAKEFVEDNIIGYKPGDISGAFNEFWKDVVNGFKPVSLSDEDLQLYQSWEDAIFGMVKSSQIEGNQGVELLTFLDDLRRNGEEAELAILELKNKLDGFGISSDTFDQAIDAVGKPIKEIGETAQDTKNKVGEMSNKLNTVNFENISEQLTGFKELVQTLDFAQLVAETANTIDEMGGIWEDGKQVLGEKALQIYNEIQDGLEPDENGYYHLANGQMVQYGEGIADYEENLQNTLDATLGEVIQNALPEGYNLYKDIAENQITGYGHGLESQKDNIQKAADGVVDGIWNKGKANADADGKAIGQNVGTGLKKGIYGSFGEVSKAMMEFIENSIKSPAQTSLQSHSPSKWFEDLAVFCGQGFNNGLEPGFQSVFAFFQNFGTRIGNIIGKLDYIGHNAIIGINNGMVEASETLYSNARQIAQNISGIFRNTLQIHSPSKVMQELGSYTMEGFNNGLEGWLNKIESLAQRLSESMQSALQINVPSISVPVTLNPAAGNIYPRQIPVMAQGTIAPPHATDYDGRGKYGAGTSLDISDIKRVILEALQESRESDDDQPMVINLNLDGQKAISWLVEMDNQARNRSGRGIFEGGW